LHATQSLACHLGPCDALERHGDAQGATIYTLSETASDAAAARLAEVDNRADVIAGLDIAPEATDVADILIDLAIARPKLLVQFAPTLVSKCARHADEQGSRCASASFVLLKAPAYPCPVELGYVKPTSKTQS